MFDLALLCSEGEENECGLTAEITSLGQTLAGGCVNKGFTE